MEVTCGRHTHKTHWVLSPDGDKPFYYDPVDTPNVSMEGREYLPESWVILCPDCGIVWARRYNLDLPNKSWKVRTYPCLACGNGSLWDAWNKPWNRSFPMELLCRELEIVKAWYDEGIRTYHQFFQHKHFRRKV